jgi:GNAT superfamily N-acetyltransferase
VAVHDDDTLTFSIEQDAPPETQTRIESLLEQEAQTWFGHPRDPRRFCAVLRNSDGTIEGGVEAQAYWGWLQVRVLVVAPPWRGRGFGRRLLASAEAWGLDCACRDAWLMTMRVQARTFYEQAGYALFAELPNFPERETRFFMRKSLDARSTKRRDALPR